MPKHIFFINLTDKDSAIQLLIVVHVFLYIFVLAWGGVVRAGQGASGSVRLELLLALIAIVLCIVFQVY